MSQKSYKTLDDVLTIVAENIPEGLNLEYKSSSILIERDANAVCKTISALANSAGGVFIIGIETKNLMPTRIDEGTPGPSKRDWIYQIVNGGTFPAIEALDVREFRTPTGAIYVLEVPPSPHAPHQSYDRKYYKRRGSHSEVMEHYEIEDIRSRPKEAILPLRAELTTRSFLADLRIANGHKTETITDLRCETEANFPLDHEKFNLLKNRGLRSLLPSSEIYFLLGSLIEILQNEEPTVTFKFAYKFREKPMTHSVTLYLADLYLSSIMKTPIETALDKLGDKMDKVAGQLEKIHRSAETLTKVADSTGLRLSQRSLRTLKDLPQLFDPQEFDADGYRIIAEISPDEAHALSRIFHYFSSASAKEQYEKISPQARTNFERFFRIDFGDNGT
jgi:hypothetical protein